MLTFVNHLIISTLKNMIDIILCMHNILNSHGKYRINQGFELNQVFQQKNMLFVDNYFQKSPKMYPEIQN